MNDPIVAGLFLMLVGGLQAFGTKWFIRFHIWVQKKLMGADYVPSSRTYKIVRVFGTVILILGLYMIIRGIKL